VLTEFKLPSLGENIKSGVATKIMVKPGDSVSVGQNVLELETDKAVLEVPSSVSGIVKEILVKANTQVNVGQTIMILDASAIAAPSTPVLAKEISGTKPPVGTGQGLLSAAPAFVSSEIFTASRKDVPAAPSVRKFSREIGIDIAQVPGTGAKGRISIEDVKAYSKALNSGARPSMSGPAALPLPDFARWGELDRQPLSQLRRTTAERLSYAWATIPHVTQFDKANITDLEVLRKKYSAKAGQKGVKLTMTPFIIKVLASALKNFPKFNASLDLTHNEVVHKKYYNMGIAVDTDRGLIVPVIRNIDKKSVLELSVELALMAQKARDKKTTIEDMQGGTFTITNLGGIGGTSFTPIINWPEVAILGVSRSALEFSAPRLMLPLSLSYDHRVIDGADGARFLRWVVDAMEHPSFMDLEG